MRLTTSGPVTNRRPSSSAAQAELDERVAAGEIEIFNGTPDTAGQGFVVNCLVPIVAPNDFEVTG